MYQLIVSGRLLLEVKKIKPLGIDATGNRLVEWFYSEAELTFICSTLLTISDLIIGANDNFSDIYFKISGT